MRWFLFGLIISGIAIGVPIAYSKFSKPKYILSSLPYSYQEIERKYREEVISQINEKLEGKGVSSEVKDILEKLKNNLGREENNKLVERLNSLLQDDEIKSISSKLVIRWEPDERKVKIGKEIFENLCMTCHGRAGDSFNITPEGLKTDIGYPIYARDFTGKYHREGKVVFKFASDYFGEFASDEDLKKIIKEGLAGTPMPGFTYLSDEEINSLLEYIKSLNPRWKFASPQPKNYPVPPTDLLSEERIERGRRQFMTVCIACHRNIESGEEPLEQPLAWYKFDKKGNIITQDGSPSFQMIKARWFGKEPLRRGKPEYIFATIRDGIAGTTMTPWRHLGDETIWDLVSYILYIEKKGAASK
jgi:mono/diheme cytochrome c family protein